MADPYTYLSQIGLYILIAWAVADLTSGWRPRHVVCGAAAACILPHGGTMAMSLAARSAQPIAGPGK